MCMLRVCLCTFMLAQRKYIPIHSLPATVGLIDISRKRRKRSLNSCAWEISFCVRCFGTGGRDCSLRVSLTTNHTGLNGGGRVPPECDCFVRVCIFFPISFVFKYFHYSVWTLRRLCSCTEKITRTLPLPPPRYSYICVCAPPSSHDYSRERQ